MNCPCCSSLPYDQCCGRILERHEDTETPEVLMRSRYSAYVLKNYEHILSTYAKAPREKLTVANLKNDATNTRWIKLTIHDSTLTNDEMGFVEFSAFYLVDDTLFEMRENSRFIRENGRWVYVDGDIKYNDKVVKVQRNDSCPCDSGKKFKKCCQNT